MCYKGRKPTLQVIRKSMAPCWAVVGFYLLFGIYVTESKKGHPIPTFFKRINSEGLILDVRDQRNHINFTRPIVKKFEAACTLKVSPDVVENGAAVIISWSGIPQPDKSDFIAFYCPNDAEASQYLDYFYVTVSANYASGYGRNQVNVYNMRSSCEFRYYQKNYIHAATSNLLKFKGGVDAPLQGHIALTGDPTQMRVMWVSGTGRFSGVQNCFRFYYIISKKAGMRWVKLFKYKFISIVKISSFFSCVVTRLSGHRMG